MTAPDGCRPDDLYRPPEYTAEEHAEAVALGHRLACLAERDPLHPLLVGAQAAVEIAAARAAERQAHAEASKDVASAADWRQIGNAHVPYDELTRRRQEIPAQWTGMERSDYRAAAG